MLVLPARSTCAARYLSILAALFLALLPAASFASTLHQEAPAQQDQAAQTAPDIQANAAIVVEYPSGRILYEKNAHERRAPASTTKILTAILAIEYGKLDEQTEIVQDDLIGESSMGLVNGEHQTLHNLLYGMLLPSGNDAAMAIARMLGSKVESSDPSLKDPISRFVAMMNVRIGQLGLADTHFVNPHGLDADGHYSSAYDLASLSWYALHLPVFNEVVKQISYEAPNHPLLNTNEMLTRYAGADGIKTGWTDAGGLCLVTSATRDGHRLISVVLNDPTWWGDSAAILDYGFASLATTPTDAQADVLSISQRGTVAWLLQNGALPSLQPAAPTGQGGGTAPSDGPQRGAGQAAPVQQPESAAPAAETAQAAQLAHTVAIVSGGDKRTPGTIWVVVAAAVLLVAGILIGSRLVHFRPRMRFAGYALTDTATRIPRTSRSKEKRTGRPEANVTGVSRPPAPRRGPARPVAPDPLPIALQQPVARTLGAQAPTSVRRREPNLMMSRDEEREMHLGRAVALAWENRQGSSMSEFLLAFRLGGTLDAGEIAEKYRLNADAFLALSRAQLSIGDAGSAQRTLLHAVSVLPNDRLLRLALNQLRVAS